MADATAVRTTNSPVVSLEECADTYISERPGAAFDTSDSAARTPASTAARREPLPALPTTSPVAGGHALSEKKPASTHQQTPLAVATTLSPAVLIRRPKAAASDGPVPAAAFSLTNPLPADSALAVNGDAPRRNPVPANSPTAFDAALSAQLFGAAVPSGQAAPSRTTTTEEHVGANPPTLARSPPKVVGVGVIDGDGPYGGDDADLALLFPEEFGHPPPSVGGTVPGGALRTAALPPTSTPMSTEVRRVPLHAQARAPAAVPAHATSGSGAAVASSPVELLGDLSELFGFPSFNKVQAACAPKLFGSDQHVVVAAPTGSGKTALLELALARLFRHRLRRFSADATRTGGPSGSAAEFSGKAVYICPIKALANEKYAAWSSKFGRFGLRVVLETGDTKEVNAPTPAQTGEASAAAASGADAGPLSDVLTADIVISTPERWDSISRRWRQGGSAVSAVAAVRLLLIDEVHVLGEARGAVIEALVSRMKTVASESATDQHPPAASDPSTAATAATESTANAAQGPPLRFVAVSGTMPNAGDVATWLGASPNCLFEFTDADRPVKLTTHVVAFPSTSTNAFAFGKLLSFKLPTVLRQYSDGKPSLVFCCSRKDTSVTADQLAKDLQHELTAAAAAQLGIAHTVLKASLLDSATKCTDSTLKHCIPFGIAFHHAALSPRDRGIVEGLFLEQLVRVVCTTTTLAMGVNLPARLVVVKGTGAPARAQGGGSTSSGSFLPRAAGAVPGTNNGFAPDDLPLSEIRQMAGRAGRPGLDTEGVAVVLTQERKLPLYEHLDSAYVARGGATPAATMIESQLHSHMVEHLNAEVCLGTVTNTRVAVRWLQTTFLWVRLLRNPTHYGISAAALTASGSAADAGGDSASDDDDDLLFVCGDCNAGEAAVTRPRGKPRRRLAGAAQASDDGDLVNAVGGHTVHGPSATRRTERFTTAAERLETQAQRFAKKLARSILTALVRENCVDVSRQATIVAGGGAGSMTTVATPTRLGRLMAQYYLSFGTVQQFNRRVGKLFGGPAIMARFAKLEALEQPAEEPEDAAADDDAEAGTAGGGNTNQQSAGGDDGRPSAPKPTVDVLLETVSAAEEFQDCRIRQGDKQHLNALNAQIRFPVRSGKVDPKTGRKKPAAGGRDVKDVWHKVFILIQCQIHTPSNGAGAAVKSSAAAAASSAGGGGNPSSTLPQLDWSLRNDALRLIPVANRISRALVEYCSFIGSGEAIVQAWHCARSIDQRLWWDSARTARQLDGVGDVLLRGLERAGAASLRQLVDADPRRLEAACSRNPPFGSDIVAKARAIPSFVIEIAPAGAAKTVSATSASSRVVAGTDGKTDQQQHAAQATPAAVTEVVAQLMPLMHPDTPARKSFFTVVAFNNSTGQLVAQRRFRVLGTRVPTHNVSIKLPKPASHSIGSAKFFAGRPSVTVAVINEQFVGLDATASYTAPFATGMPNRRRPRSPARDNNAQPQTTLDRPPQQLAPPLAQDQQPAPRLVESAAPAAAAALPGEGAPGEAVPRTFERDVEARSLLKVSRSDNCALDTAAHHHPPAAGAAHQQSDNPAGRAPEPVAANNPPRTPVAPAAARTDSVDPLQGLRTMLAATRQPTNPLSALTPAAAAESCAADTTLSRTPAAPSAPAGANQFVTPVLFPGSVGPTNYSSGVPTAPQGLGVDPRAPFGAVHPVYLPMLASLAAFFQHQHQHHHQHHQPHTEAFARAQHHHHHHHHHHAVPSFPPPPQQAGAVVENPPRHHAKPIAPVGRIGEMPVLPQPHPRVPTTERRNAGNATFVEPVGGGFGFNNAVGIGQLDPPHGFENPLIGTPAVEASMHGDIRSSDTHVGPGFQGTYPTEAPTSFEDVVGGTAHWAPPPVAARSIDGWASSSPLPGTHHPQHQAPPRQRSLPPRETFFTTTQQPATPFAQQQTNPRGVPPGSVPMTPGQVGANAAHGVLLRQPHRRRRN